MKTWIFLTDGVDRNLWVDGNLNNTYHFDFGAAYAYQIQLSKKLIQLESTFLKNANVFGHVEALLGGNPTGCLFDESERYG